MYIPNEKYIFIEEALEMNKKVVYQIINKASKPKKSKYNLLSQINACPKCNGEKSILINGVYLTCPRCNGQGFFES